MDDFFRNYRNAMLKIQPASDLAEKTLATLSAGELTPEKRTRQRFWAPLASAAACLAIACLGVFLTLYAPNEETGMPKAEANELFLEVTTLAIKNQESGVISLNEDEIAIILDISLVTNARTTPFFVSIDGNCLIQTLTNPKDHSDAWHKSMKVDPRLETQGQLKIVLEPSLQDLEKLRDGADLDVVYAKMLYEALHSLGQSHLILSAEGYKEASYSFHPHLGQNWRDVQTKLNGNETIVVALEKIE